MKNNKGITLIALVVSIIVMLIIAGVSINGVLNSSTIDKAREASFKSEAQDIKDAWEAKIIGIDSTYLDYDDLSKVLGGSNASEDILEKLEIQNGELVYKNDKCTDEEKSWLENLGIYGGVSISTKVKTKINIVGSDLEIQVKEQAMDVVLVLDVSGSMEDKDSGVKRSEKMTNVINSTMEQILKANPNNRVGIMQFSNGAGEFIPLDHYTCIKDDGIYLEYKNGDINTYSSTTSNGGWWGSTTKTSLIKNSKGNEVEKSISVTGGTYTQSGMIEAYKTINARSDKSNLPAIILITDGLPTYYSQFDINSVNGSLGTRKGRGNSTDQNHGYYNILTSAWIKKKIPDIRMYNIAIADFQGADRIFMDLTLNPSNENIENAKTYNRSGDNITRTTLNNLAQSISNQINSDSSTNYFYANGYAIGALSEEELNTWFKSVIEDITNNLQKGGLTVGSDNDITGIFQVDSDNLTYTTTIGENGKTEDGTDVEGTYYFRLAEDDEIHIRVKAAAFKKSTNESDAELIEGTEYTTPDKTFSIQNIKDGVEPNLYYLDGQIKWNVRSEYKNREGLAKEAIDGVRLENDNQVAEIVEIDIELPVITTDFVPKDESGI